MSRRERVELIDNCLPSSVVVWIRGDDLSAVASQMSDRLQGRAHLLRRALEFGCHRMLSEQHHAAGEIQAKPVAHLFAGGVLALLNQIDRWKANRMNSPAFLSELEDTVRRLHISGEMNMRQLRHRMAN